MARRGGLFTMQTRASAPLDGGAEAMKRAPVRTPPECSDFMRDFTKALAREMRVPPFPIFVFAPTNAAYARIAEAVMRLTPDQAATFFLAHAIRKTRANAEGLLGIGDGVVTSFTGDLVDGTRAGLVDAAALGSAVQAFLDDPAGEAAANWAVVAVRRPLVATERLNEAWIEGLSLARASVAESFDDSAGLLDTLKDRAKRFLMTDARRRDAASSFAAVYNHRPTEDAKQRLASTVGTGEKLDNLVLWVEEAESELSDMRKNKELAAVFVDVDKPTDGEKMDFVMGLHDALLGDKGAFVAYLAAGRDPIKADKAVPAALAVNEKVRGTVSDFLRRYRAGKAYPNATMVRYLLEAAVEYKPTIIAYRDSASRIVTAARAPPEAAAPAVAPAGAKAAEPPPKMQPLDVKALRDVLFAEHGGAATVDE